MKISVSLVEDDRKTRESLASLIERAPRFALVGSHGTVEEALREVPKKLPDVLLMDINLADGSGVECTRQLKAAHPELHVLILTTYDDSDLIFGALRAGANGYLLKRSRPAELLRAIEEVFDGGAPMSARIARLVVAHFHQMPKASSEMESLTAREREVLEQLAKGRLYKEVADQLGIGLGTVNKHVAAIYKKLHVQTRAEAVLKLRPE
jgi:DNA-binding NarL/FixJ family response regulator